MSGIYKDIFQSNADIIGEFEAPADALDGAEVLFAEYSYESYEGSAFVLFKRDGKLYEVSGGHCSCYGLEGQWDPEETSPEALLKRTYVTGELKEIAQRLQSEVTERE